MKPAPSDCPRRYGFLRNKRMLHQIFRRKIKRCAAGPAGKRNCSCLHDCCPVCHDHQLHKTVNHPPQQQRSPYQKSNHMDAAAQFQPRQALRLLRQHLLSQFIDHLISSSNPFVRLNIFPGFFDTQFRHPVRMFLHKRPYPFRIRFRIIPQTPSNGFVDEKFIASKVIDEDFL